MKRTRPIMGMQLLRRQVLYAVEEEILGCEDWVKGDSEIEKVMHAAIIFRFQYGRSEYDEALIGIDAEHAERLRKNSANRFKLIIESQVQIGAYRVDFVVSAWTYGQVWNGKNRWSRGEPRWRRLVIECDGHDFHERTKEQAARDRSRDRSLNNDGYDVFRFTGSEIWRDPWGCADQIYEWAVRGFDYDPDVPE